jgi:hypothetical protein
LLGLKPTLEGMVRDLNHTLGLWVVSSAVNNRNTLFISNLSEYTWLCAFEFSTIVATARIIN